ncbi:Ldb7p PWA37_000605 [Arxiozyma heterogenica]|uniref:Uncharacterized protein n=1 Tax=Arxiozyma heterogenica TaxID=278026 RepID=A0AAN7ZZ91_9SACH|nr:hypothetical protein RI543_000014 [Kazachstania heterogenica]
MTSVPNSKSIRINIRSKPVAKKNYYDIIAGLAAFEKSQDVVLTRQELVELTKDRSEGIDGGRNMGAKDKDEMKDNNSNGSDSSDGGETNSDKETGTKEDVKGQNKQDSKRLSRPNLHGYLGGKVDMEEIKVAQHDLSHTLLGSYIPKRQLESLTSLDFAQYFHKALECEESLQIYDLFIQPVENIKSSSVAPKKIENGNSNNSNNITKDSLKEIDPSDLEHNQRVYQWTKPDGKVVRKVVLCNRCNGRFFGPNRMKQLLQHNCKMTK